VVVVASILVLDTNERVSAVLDSKAAGACPFWDDLHTARVDGYCTYEFSCPGDHEVSKSLDPGVLCLIRDVKDRIVFLRILMVDDVRDDKGHVRKVTCESAHQELNGAIVRPTTYTGQPLSVIIPSLLTGSRWSPGVIEFDGIYTAEYNDYPTVLKALKDLIAEAGMEVRYRVEMSGSRVTGRYIDIVQSLGSDTGKIVEYKKDLRGITRTGDATNVVTALIGLGASNTSGFTTFTNTGWTTPTNPVAKPAGQDWIGDTTALMTFGIPNSDGSRTHIFGTFTDADETSPTKLLDKTYAELKRRCQLPYTYDVDMVLLDQAPAQSPLSGDFEHEKVDLGDTVTVRDLTFDPPVATKVRVLETRRSYTNPQGTSNGDSIGGR
jgi:phage minor structural protein